MTESPITFDCGGETLLGVLSQPDHVGEPGVVIVVGGPQYRAGSHRQFVHLARRVAQAGYPVLRFDVRGMGDSEGDPRSFEALAEDVDAAIGALCHHARVSRVVLFGLCDGASAILLRAAHGSDVRVAGMVLLNPWARTEAGLARAQVQHYYGRRLLQPAFWRKLLSGDVAWSALTELIGKLGRALSPAAARQAGFQDRMASGWAGSGQPILLLISAADLTAQEFISLVRDDPAWQLAMQVQPARLVTLADTDHTCSTPSGRQACETAMLAWLGTTFPGPNPSGAEA
jgi:uncharacterized protein